MRISFVGAGRVATNMALAAKDAGYEIAGVYSRTLESASELALRVGARPTSSLEELPDDADVCIVSIKDDALPHVLPALCPDRSRTLFLHTAGSVGMDVFEGYAVHYGVFYPLQTFSKERRADFSVIPIFIEGVDEYSLGLAMQFAASLSRIVVEMSSADRRWLHLAAVFACNFTNHCFQLSSEVLAKVGLPFDVMLPLVRETVEKLSCMTPQQAQTGPAVRYDKTVIDSQLSMLDDDKSKHEIYRLMTESIHLKSFSHD